MRFNTLSLFIIVVAGCVDPYHVATRATSPRLVVEGFITNGTPPYEVTLTESANYSKELDGITRYVSGASIQICDDTGVCNPLVEVSKGKYKTALDATPGVVGKSYHVEITTPDGRIIFSRPEMLKTPPPIKRVYYEYDVSTVLTEGFKVYIDTEDPAGERNYYKWETESYFPYSRFCFTREVEKDINYIASDKNVDGNTLSRIRVKNVPLTSTSYWVVQVYQFSLSAEAFSFFDGIKKQINSKGSIFDAPPSYLRGNLYNRNDPDEVVLGYFFASAATRMDVAVNRADPNVSPRPSSQIVSDPLYCGDPCNQDCVTRGGGTCGTRPCPPDCASLPGKTNIAPDAWPLPHQSCGN
jgi:hypothetical protein